jgi:hypothetical protein
MADNFFKAKKGLNVQPVAAASATEKGDIVYDSSTDKLKYYNGSERDIVNTNEDQTLSNKTLTAPAIDVMTLDGQGSTPANPSAGFYKIYVSDTTSKLTVLDSSGNATSVGGGSGLKNYISYPDAEAGTTGWSTYADAAATRPVDGTGGSPSSTWAASSSTPLSTNNDYNWTKSANNRQGEGVAYAFTIDRSDQGKPLQIEFNYELISGTWAGSVAPATDSDMIVYIYDVTNAVLIEPQGRLLEPMVTSMYYRYRGTFQTAINSTSYRLILHTATTSASAYTLAFDDFRIGPQVVSNGAVVTDWKDANSVAAGTLITAETSNPTYGTVQNNICRWRRVGSNAEIEWDYRQSAAGSNGSGIYYFNIPPEIGVIDTTYKPINTNTTSSTYDAANSSVGLFTAASSAGYMFQGAVVPHSATKVKFHNSITGASQGSQIYYSGDTAFNQTIMSAQLRMSIPIVGWSSNVQMSSDSDTRVLAFNATTSTTSINTTPARLALTAVTDTHGGLVSNQYVIPVAGIYHITSSVYFSRGGSLGSATCELRKNNTAIHTANADNDYGMILVNDKIVSLVAGDLIDFFAYTDTSTASTTSTKTSFSIKRLSGPSQIAASEKVVASYYINSNTAYSANDYLNYDTKVIDTHNAVTTGSGTTWKFTAPMTSSYRVSCSASTTSGAANLVVMKSGANHKYITQANTGIATGSCIISLTAGQTLSIKTEGALTYAGLIASIPITIVDIESV